MRVPVITPQTDAVHQTGWPPFATEMLYCHTRNLIWAAVVPLGTVYVDCPFCGDACQLRNN